MFIELTDHLRCTADHAESYLVLLPELMDGRRVLQGDLGCPVCGRVVRIAGGVADFGGQPASDPQTSLSADALAPLLGITGPGGYVALVGGVTSLAVPLGALLPDVGLALINPPDDAASPAGAGILRAARLPLKSGSMRGVVLGRGFSGAASWVGDAVRAVLPGLRVIGEGGEPSEGVELLARSPECWVGKKTASGLARSDG